MYFTNLNLQIFKTVGIETVRRDTCAAVAKILQRSLCELFVTRDVSLVKKYVQRQVRMKKFEISEIFC